ncbi:hypothetical protein FGA82_10860 [Pseudomonas fluorescens]|uniref:hypothetical protein n=1 Tax=Pseudomonas fluorescens TaxID=294 RepID=UPI0011308CEE|nr:hypothetical protein [Pseudomonas fluorescens]TMU80264.1 hypothetical protein FGA82_10860 [Pseudomonas fluorescens]
MRFWQLRSEGYFLLVGFLVSLAVTLMYIVPWLPEFPGDDLEHSWQLGMNYASAHGMSFGQDILFTFGPFSAVYTKNYYPGLFGWTVAISSFIGLFLSLSFLRVTSKNISGSIFLLVWGGLISVIASLYLRDALFLIVPFMTFLVIRIDFIEGRLSVLAVMGLVALACITLVKGTFAISSIVLLGLLFLLQAPWRIRVAPVIIYVSTVIALWLAAGQTLPGLVSHALGILPIVSGYTDAMSTTGSIWTVLIYIVGCLLALLISLGFKSIPTSLALAATLFFSFKGAYVRQDIHEIIAAGMLALTSCILLALWLRWSTVVLAAVSVLLSVVTYNNQIGLPVSVFFGEFRSQALRSVNSISSMLSNPESLREIFLSRMNGMASQNVLPRFEGTVDIYSFRQASLLAHNVNWTPRPIIQSYAAYNGILARINAEYLSRNTRPANLLFNIEPIDGRYSAMDDGLSWPEIWANYELKDRFSSGLHFVSAAHSKAVVFEDSKIIHADLGEEIDVSAESSGLLWANIDVKKNLLGKFVSLIFRAPRLYIELKTIDGKTESFRYLAQVGTAGFLLSPKISSTDEFQTISTRIESGESIVQSVTSIRIYQEESWIKAFDENIEVKLAPMKIVLVR